MKEYGIDSADSVKKVQKVINNLKMQKIEKVATEVLNQVSTISSALQDMFSSIYASQEQAIQDTLSTTIATIEANLKTLQQSYGPTASQLETMYEIS